MNVCPDKCVQQGQHPFPVFRFSRLHDDDFARILPHAGERFFCPQIHHDRVRNGRTPSPRCVPLFRRPATSESSYLLFCPESRFCIHKHSKTFWTSALHIPHLPVHERGLTGTRCPKNEVPFARVGGEFRYVQLPPTPVLAVLAVPGFRRFCVRMA